MDAEAVADESYEERQMLWEGLIGRRWSKLVQQWGVPVVESPQLHKSIAALVRGVGPQLGELHWEESTGLGRESKVLPGEAVGMLEAGQTARRLMDPGWRGEKGQGRWRAKNLLEWAAKELTLGRMGIELEFGDTQGWRQRGEAERRMEDSLLEWLGLGSKPPQQRVRHKVWREQLVGNTRQLKLGADRARQRSDIEMLDGTEAG